jgi:hypothetical protein
MSLWFGTADAPAPEDTVEASGSGLAQVSVTVAMQPPSASNSVEVTYRVNGGAPATVPAALLTHDPQQRAQYFRAQLPAFHVGDTVEYRVVGRAPGHQVPGARQAGQFAASFRVVPDPPPEGAAPGPKAAAPMHPALIGPAAAAAISAVPSRIGAVRQPSPGAAGLVHLGGAAAGAATGTAAATQPAGEAALHLGAGFAAGAAHLRRIPSTLDPLSEAGGQIADTLLPLRTAALSRFYLGVDRVRVHLQLVTDALSSRSLPARLFGVLQQPDGTAARLVQLQFDPASVDGKGAKATVITKDDGSFSLALPPRLPLPDGGLPLTVHGGDGTAPLTIPADRIAANGVCGSVVLPNALGPLHVSILDALTALLPADAAAPQPGAGATPAHLHVVKLGEDDGCPLAFKANSAVDKFPYGVFFRLVEPQTSIPQVTLRAPAARGFFPIPQYAGASAPAGGNVTYVDRIPVEQPVSMDGFRDQIAGVTAGGVIAPEETVPMAGTLGLGYTLWMSQRWTFQGLALGDLVYSLALAPGEQQQVAIFERVDTASVRESEFFTEEETRDEAARADTSTQATFNSAFNEMVNGGSQFTAHSSSSSVAGGGAFSLGIVSFGGGGSSGSSDSSGQTSQWLQGQRDVTQQAAEQTHSAAESHAAARRSAMRTSMRTATASESESVTTKVITNHNHTRALTLQYWEVLRLYDVSTGIDGLTLICLVPLQVVRFLPPGQSLTLSDPALVSGRALVMARYGALIRHADVLARALPRPFRYGLGLLQQFAADPTAQVEPFGGVAEDVIGFSVTGTFLPCEDIYIQAVTRRNTRVGPVKLVSPARIPNDVFASQEELLAALSQARQGNAPAVLQWSSPLTLTGSLALPASLNRSDIVGFEFTRSFRPIDYTLVPPEMAAVNALDGLFSGKPPSWFNVGPFQLDGSAISRTTVHLTPGDLESALGGPLLYQFQAAIQDLDAAGDLKAGGKGEAYANDSLNGVELPAQPYPVPAVQIGPVLRFNQILEIEKMAQHVVRNTVQYSRAVWSSMSPDERAILLEHYTIGVPADGIADESQMVPLLNCVENRVLGFFGNSMMLPFLIPQAVSEQIGIDPVELQNALLAYQQDAFQPPRSTIALPTRGVLGEAVLGHCPSAEKIDLTRFWNWADAPADTAPAIAPVALPTTTPSIAAGLTAPNTLTNLPPLINNVLTAPTPDTSLLQALSKSAASQQDFSPSFTGAQQLASLLTNAQNNANSARADALKSSNQLISQAMTTAASLLSSQGGQVQGQGQAKGQKPGGSPGTSTPGAGSIPGAGTSAADGASAGDAAGVSAGAPDAAGISAGAGDAAGLGAAGSEVADVAPIAEEAGPLIALA